MNAQTQILDFRQQELLKDAVFWRLISLLFECPVAGWRESLAPLAAVAEDADLTEAVEAAQAEASEELYHSTFSPGHGVSPREVSYRGSLDYGGILSALTGYYHAFGYHPSNKEPCDHVAIETGFVGYLDLKEAYALACGNGAHADVTAEASKHFVHDHLSAMAQPLAAALEGSGVRYLALAGKALVRRIKPGA